MSTTDVRQVQPMPENMSRDLDGTQPTSTTHMYQVASPPGMDLRSVGPDFSARGGWGHAVQRGRGVIVDELPDDWQQKLTCIAGDDGCVTLEKLASAAARQRAAVNVSSGKIDVRGFPEHLHAALQAFDSDGSGDVDSQELQHAAALYSESQRSVKQTVRMIIVLLLSVIVLCGVLAGLTYAVVEGTKEVRATGATTPEGQVLLTVGHGDNKGAPATTMIPSIDLPLGVLTYIPEVLWSTQQLKVELEVPVGINGGHMKVNRTYYVTGFDMAKQDDARNLTLYTVSGDTIHMASLAGLVTHRDGKEVRFCGLCVTCGAVNVVRSPAVERGLKEFHNAVVASGANATATHLRRATPLLSCGAAGLTNRQCWTAWIRLFYFFTGSSARAY